MARSKLNVDRRAAFLAVWGGVVTVIALFALWLASAVYFRVRGESESSFPLQPTSVSPITARPILFTDWAVDNHGQVVWVTDGYLRLIPDNLWVSLDLREEVLEKSADYRWLEMEVFALPRSDWKISVFVFYEDYRDERFQLAPKAEYLGGGWFSTSFDREHRILVSPDGWEKVRLPLHAAEYGGLKSLNLTAYFGEVLIRNITLVP